MGKLINIIATYFFFHRTNVFSMKIPNFVPTKQVVLSM